MGEHSFKKSDTYCGMHSVEAVLVESTSSDTYPRPWTRRLIFSTAESNGGFLLQLPTPFQHLSNTVHSTFVPTLWTQSQHLTIDSRVLSAAVQLEPSSLRPRAWRSSARFNAAERRKEVRGKRLVAPALSEETTSMFTLLPTRPLPRCSPTATQRGHPRPQEQCVALLRSVSMSRHFHPITPHGSVLNQTRDSS